MRALFVLLAACHAPTAGVRWPPIIDSHVHLSFDPVGDELARRGVLAAVDLAAPEATLGPRAPIALVQAGPMLTHGGGYPLDAWGAGGYGIGCDDAACVRTTIDRLAREGARAVISTLAAFGGSAAAVDNLRRLRAAGVTVLYGTDLGNTRDAGPSADEIALLAQAGLDDAAITAAMTTTPAAFWGIDLAGASLLLDGDPCHDVRQLLHPREVHKP